MDAQDDHGFDEEGAPDVDLSVIKLFPLAGTLEAQAEWIKDAAEFRRSIEWFKQEGGKLRDPVLGLLDGERLRFVPVPNLVEHTKQLLSSVEHRRHGLRCVCPQFTASPLQPDGSEIPAGCPVCALALPLVKAGAPLPDGLLNLRYHFLPVLPHSYVDERGRWKRFSDPLPALVRLPDHVVAKNAHDLAQADAVWQVERWGSYSFTRIADYRWTESNTQNLELHFAVPPIVYRPDDLAAMAANLFNQPVPGRAADLLDALPDAVLIPAGLGSKRPSVRGWPNWTRRDSALRCADLDDGNIALLTGPQHAVLDIDSDDYVQPFLRANPWAHGAMQTVGRRGLRVHFRAIRDGWPSRTFTIHKSDPQGNALLGLGNHVGEVKLAGSLCTLSGFHPSGCAYRVAQALGALPDVTLADFNFPPGAVPHLPTVRAKGEYSTTPGECSLDLSKLEALRDGRNGMLVGRCPCCASHGGDRNAEHLAIWPSGAYSCITGCAGSDIFALAGRKRRKRSHPWI